MKTKRDKQREYTAIHIKLKKKWGEFEGLDPFMKAFPRSMGVRNKRIREFSSSNKDLMDRLIFLHEELEL